MKKVNLFLLILLLAALLDIVAVPADAEEDNDSVLNKQQSQTVKSSTEEAMEETEQAIGVEQQEQREDAPDTEWVKPESGMEDFVADDGNRRSEIVEKNQLSDLQDWEVILVDWLNNKNPDYQPVIDDMTNVFSGNLPIGNTVNSFFSRSFNIKTPSIRRYIGYKPNAGFLGFGLDIWITGNSYTDVKNLDAKNANFTSTINVGNDQAAIGVNRTFEPSIKGEYLLEVQPQYALAKLEFYDRYDGRHYQTSYPNTYYYGERKNISGTFNMLKYSMEIKDNKSPSITAPLGSSTETVNEQIRNQLEVTVGGQTIDKNDYTISYTNLRKDTIGQKKVDFTLSWKLDTSVKVSGKGNLNVTWDSSIAFGALDISGNGRTGAVFTLQQLTEPTIIATQGVDDDNEEIHSYFPNKKYYGFDWFDIAAVNEREISEAIKGDTTIESNGNERKQEALKKWPEQRVNYGDVVRAWHAESGRNWLYENEQRNNYSEGKATVYYEITKTGFKTMNINRLTPKKQTINYRMTNSELSKNVGSYLSIGAYDKLAVTKFIKYPDTSQQGDTEGIIQVAETLATGRKVVYNYTVPFQVDRLTASPQAGSVALGAVTQELDYTSYVKDVQFNGEVLKAEEYTVSSKSDLATGWIGSKSLDVRVSLKSDTSKFTDVTVPIDVKWGNSVVFGCYDLGENGRTGAAFTLHRSSENAKITASLGQYNDNLQIHSSFPGKKYYGFDWFDLKNSNVVDVSEEKTGTKTITAMGDEGKSDAVNKWTPQIVNYGDVVRAWQLEPFRNWLYEDEQKQTYNDGKVSVYYEVTKDGFKPLTMTKLSVEKQIINYGMNESELDKNLNNYLSTEGYNKLEAVKFIKYPDTARQGETTGTIQVAETLLSGKKITYEYMVPFQVDRLTADSKAGAMDLGTNIQPLDYNRFVENVQFNGQKLNEELYTVEAIKPLQTDTVGTTNLSLNISLKSNPSKFVTIDVPITVKWGSSVVYGSYDIYGNGRTSAAFTLHTTPTPLITSSSGISDDNAQIHSSFIGLKYYGFDWFNLSKTSEPILSETLIGDQSIEALGNELKKDTLEKWAPQAVNYGDIVRAWQLETGKSWLYENEQREAYNDGKNAVYYEVTSAGFKPLKLNQLSTKKQVIDFDMTHEELDKNIKTYLDTAGYSALEVEKFVKYPDTSQAGATEGIIRVTEMLTNGKKVSYDYTVPFQISDPTTLVDVAIPTKLLFGSLDVEEGQVSSPKYTISNNGEKRLKTTIDRVEISKNQDSIRLLTPNDSDPVEKEPAVRLNVLGDQSETPIAIVAGIIDQQLAVLAPEEKSNFQLEGRYFGDFSQNTSLELRLSYTFQVMARE